MKLRLVLAVLLRQALLLLFCIALTSCQSRQSNTGPSIEFSKIPPAAQGGRERVDTIAGLVRNARPGQQIVIYARSGPWWVQPWPDRAKGTGAPTFAPTKPLKFSGYDWDVRTIASDRGGTNNLYDPDNAWTDASGALHLQIKPKSGRWSCVEMVLNRSLGYGTYVVTVRDTSHLEPAAVFSMITFEEWGGDQNYREMDVEISRWGDAANKNNAQYVIQPFYIPGNVSAFNVPSGTLTHLLRWESGRATFKTFRGTSVGAGASVVSEHEFSSGIPAPGQAKIHLIFYVVASDKNPLQKASEVVIEKLEYLP